jgi:pimeloyl-ACP methyl ester carboxylesterase
VRGIQRSEPLGIRADRVNLGSGLQMVLWCREHSVETARGVLFLHGWPGTRLDWRKVLGRLASLPEASSFELLAPDLRGFGDSGRPEVAKGRHDVDQLYGPNAHLADLNELIAHYRLDEIIAVGYDLGANLAQALAREGAAVRGLVLCDPVHPAARIQAQTLDLSAELWYQALNCQPWAGRLLGHDRATVEVYLRHFYVHWWGEGSVDEDHLQEVIDYYAHPGALDTSLGWYRARRDAHQQARAQLSQGRLALPTTVLWGELDPVTPVVLAETLDQSFEQCSFVPLPGVGHFVPLEAPESVVDEVVALARKLGWV